MAETTKVDAEELIKLKKYAIISVLVVAGFNLLVAFIIALPGAMPNWWHLKKSELIKVQLCYAGFWVAMAFLSALSALFIQWKKRTLALICGSIPAGFACIGFPLGTYCGIACFINLHKKDFKDNWFARK